MAFRPQTNFPYRVIRVCTQPTHLEAELCNTFVFIIGGENNLYKCHVTGICLG